MFRNYYTAWISLLVRYDGAGSSQKDPGWKLAVLRKVLMPSPHHENGSQDIVSVAATEVCRKNIVFQEGYFRT